MITRLLLTTIGVLIATGAPPALAYISPNDVFVGDIVDTADVGSASSTAQTSSAGIVNRRSAESVVRVRQETINSSRAAEARYQQILQDPNYTPPVVAPVVAKSSSSRASSLLLTDEAQYQRRQERMAQEGGSPVVIVTGGNGGDVIDGRTGRVLHSGAPLVTASGPADIVVLASLLIAAIGTLTSVRRRMRLATSSR